LTCICPSIKDKQGLLTHVSDLFHHHRGAVAEHIGYTVHQLGGFVAYVDDGLGADLLALVNHGVKGLFARLFAQFGEEGDFAAHQRLQRAADGARDRSRAHDNAAHHALALHNAECHPPSRAR